MKKTKIKAGKSYWKYSVLGGKVTCTEWFLRSIQNRKYKRTDRLIIRSAFFVVKDSTTWVKTKKVKYKDWEYGWAKSIPKCCKTEVELCSFWKKDGLPKDHVDEIELPLRLKTTKLEAAKDLVKRAEADLDNSLKWQKEEGTEDKELAEEWIETVKMSQRDLRSSKRNLTALKKSREAKNKNKKALA